MLPTKRGIDFTEIFYHRFKLVMTRIVFWLVAKENLHLQHMYVKTVFLHSDLDEKIYMRQSKGYEVKGKDKLVCKL